MNKEEILLKSRAEENDEGLRDAENNGRKIGITAFYIVEAIIIIFNWCTNQPNYVPFSMLWAFTAAEAYPKYKITGKKSFLATTIVGGFVAILFLSAHIINVLR